MISVFCVDQKRPPVQTKPLTEIFSCPPMSLLCSSSLLMQWLRPSGPHCGPLRAGSVHSDVLCLASEGAKQALFLMLHRCFISILIHGLLIHALLVVKLTISWLNGVLQQQHTWSLTLKQGCPHPAGSQSKFTQACLHHHVTLCTTVPCGCVTSVLLEDEAA